MAPAESLPAAPPEEAANGLAVAPEHYDVLGIPIAVTSPDRAAQTLEAWSRDSVGRYVGVRDVASLMTMARDPGLLEVARQASMNLPDGMPLVWVGRHRGLPVKRTCGPDFIAHVFAAPETARLRHYFYGGREGVAQKLREVFLARHPDAMIVGVETPPFTEQDDAELEAVAGRIRVSGADVVWVGMSSPKQDVWMQRMRGRLGQTLIGVGAAFDFHTGTVRRAPGWMQRSGLEWLFRLASEPRRLWRRYLVLAPLFVFHLVTHRPLDMSAGEPDRP